MDRGDHQLPDGVHVGDVFAGRYRIGDVIGRGAMGIVLAAHHLLLDRAVAIKFLTAATDHGDAVARFVQEARAVVRLRSEHVVRVFDVAVHEDVPYIVMERLHGSDLAGSLERLGPMAAQQAVDYLLQACEAIAEAHRIGIIHRDVKPANLFLADSSEGGPTIKVLDFGIAKNTSLVAKTIGLAESAGGAITTQAKAVLGSPVYMSPEQMESAGEVDVRTDIWSLGVTLFQLITGKLPYVGTSLIQLYSMIVSQGQPAWLDEPWSRCPELKPVVAKCLQRDRSKRYASVGELATALAPFGSARASLSESRIRQALSWPAAPGAGTLALAERKPSPSMPTGPNGTQNSPLPGSLPVAAAAARPWTWPALAVATVLAVVALFVFGKTPAQEPVSQAKEEPTAPIAMGGSAASTRDLHADDAAPSAGASSDTTPLPSAPSSVSVVRPLPVLHPPARPSAARASAAPPASAIDAQSTPNTAPSPPKSPSAAAAPPPAASTFDLKQMLEPRE